MSDYTAEQIASAIADMQANGASNADIAAAASAAGVSVSEIAAATGVDTGTISQIFQDSGVAPAPEPAPAPVAVAPEPTPEPIQAVAPAPVPVAAPTPMAAPAPVTPTADLNQYNSQTQAGIQRSGLDTTMNTVVGGGNLADIVKQGLTPQAVSQYKDASGTMITAPPNTFVVSNPDGSGGALNYFFTADPKTGATAPINNPGQNLTYTPGSPGGVINGWVSKAGDIIKTVAPIALDVVLIANGVDPVTAGAITGSASSAANGGNLGDIAKAGLTGGVAGYAGGAASGAVGAGAPITSGIAGGAASGATNAALNNQNIVQGALTGGVTGGALGASGLTDNLPQPTPNTPAPVEDLNWIPVGGDTTTGPAAVSTSGDGSVAPQYIDRVQQYYDYAISQGMNPTQAAMFANDPTGQMINTSGTAETRNQIAGEGSGSYYDATGQLIVGGEQPSTVDEILKGLSPNNPITSVTPSEPLVDVNPIKLTQIQPVDTNWTDLPIGNGGAGGAVGVVGGVNGAGGGAVSPGTGATGPAVPGASTGGASTDGASTDGASTDGASTGVTGTTGATGPSVPSGTITDIGTIGGVDTLPPEDNVNTNVTTTPWKPTLTTITPDPYVPPVEPPTTAVTPVVVDDWKPTLTPITPDPYVPPVVPPTPPVVVVPPTSPGGTSKPPTTPTSSGGIPMPTTTGALVNPGLNPGYIQATPAYQTTNPVQSKFYWGQHPYAIGPADIGAYNYTPQAPATPWGAQQALTGPVTPATTRTSATQHPIQTQLHDAWSTGDYGTVNNIVKNNDISTLQTNALYGPSVTQAALAHGVQLSQPAPYTPMTHQMFSDAANALAATQAVSSTTNG